MLYEYKLDDNLSTEEIQNMFMQSRTASRNWFITGSLIFTILMGISIILVLYIYSFRWTKVINIIILEYIIGIFIILLLKKHTTKKFAKIINKMKHKKQYIEIKDNMYIYRKENFNSLLFKNSVDEIISSKEYTLIFILPKILKHVIFLPVVIPNNVFGSEEMFNEFIDKISN